MRAPPSALKIFVRSPMATPGTDFELQVNDASGAPVSNNFYWWSEDEASLRELNGLRQATLTTTASVSAHGNRASRKCHHQESGRGTGIDDQAHAQGFFYDKRILPAYYSENYVSLLPGEERIITIDFPGIRTNLQSAFVDGI